MKKVGMGTREKQAENTVPYEDHMRAVEEIERLQVVVSDRNKETEILQTENESLKAENGALKAENESLKKDNLLKK